ncbi:serpin family protein [Paenibacillus sp. 2TAB23]|uniref:serpin family protein n=1 Tax=Paenibacillus sp. 2TAB23 TaxID=3233004 RepID=UPI003F9CF17A
MVRKLQIIAVAASLLLTACGQTTETKITNRDRAQLASQADNRVVTAVNAFGLSVLKQVYDADKGENVTVSPISLTQALAMAINGASGATFDQMASTMLVDKLTRDELNKGQQKLNELLRQPGPGIKLTIANSLWLQKGWPFREDYLGRVKDTYAAELNERDLSQPATSKEINKWVNEQTNGLIPTIIDKPIPEATKLMLINALYFNGTWKDPFKPEQTKMGSFTNADGNTPQVSYMHQQQLYEYEETADYQAVRLPYGDGQMGMLVVLPQPNADRSVLIEQLLTQDDFWTKRFDSVQGKLTLPKFRIENQLDLADTLKAMGMSLPFDSQRSDFSMMADTADGNHLYINHILHKTIIDVSERGTEAAAVTRMGLDGGSAPPSKTFEMDINRPFLFAVQDLQSGLLLFAGVVETL